MKPVRLHVQWEGVIDAKWALQNPLINKACPFLATYSVPLGGYLHDSAPLSVFRQFSEIICLMPIQQLLLRLEWIIG